MTSNKLIILSGSSGVGKKTIISRLLGDDSLKLKYSVSATTRKPRVGELEGKDYYFIDEKTFNEWIDNDNFLEWAEFVGNKYGTPKSFINKTLDEGFSPLLEIEVKGALNVMNKYDKEYISIFIAPPSIDELRARLKNRNTENDDQIEQRLNESLNEIKEKDKYKYVVINDDLEKCVQEIKEIINSEK